jgi:diguanylate cyclase (GGDEF)-like protein
MAKTFASISKTWPGKVSAFTFELMTGFGGAFYTLGGLALTVFIAYLDYVTGPYLSFGIFYLIPVALCAWWGGFAHGIIIALGGAVAWHLVDAKENPMIPPIAGIWNGTVRFGTLVLTSSLIARLHAAIVRERQLARTDPLTGAANGRTFYETVHEECQRARRASRHISLAYFDVDDFKLLNDRFGHATGDAALLQIVKTIHLHLRSTDVLARIGGDEFALLMPETGADGAVALLTRLHASLVQEMTRNGWPVSLSVGAITLGRMVEDVDRLIQRADTLMYQAKQKGKGRLEHEYLDVATSESETGRRSLVEKRATARVLCNRKVRVREERQESDLSQFAIIRNISATGLSVCLDRDFSMGSILIVEALAPGQAPLLASVKNVKWDGKSWQHGCELAAQLDAEDLAFWLNEKSTASSSGQPREQGREILATGQASRA